MSCDRILSQLFSDTGMTLKLSILFLSAALGLAMQTPNANKSVWKGAYTEAQAERGQKAYNASCGGCHQPDLGGKGEMLPLKGDEFMGRWHDYSAKPLFSLLKPEM